MPEGRSPVEAEPLETGTYKTVPDPDDFKKQQNSNMVKETADALQDGADEKMLMEDEKKLPIKTDLTAVKFIADQQNGDTKIDVLQIKEAFTGLTKEELMKYCNDPFWVRLRWCVFIFFWLLWVGMLAGAIYIIVEAPKCSPPPPKTWWQTGPMIDLDAPEDNVQDNQAYFSSLTSKLPLLQKTFTGVIIPENPSHGAHTYDIPALDDIAGIKEFAENAKKNNIRWIVDLTPNYVNKTSDWFNKSELGEEPYKSYFVWRDVKHLDNGEIEPPNNWVSVFTESAWTYSEKKKQYYLHQFSSNTPDLNFRNPEVIEEFDKVLKFWLENGASGVRLSKAKHLLVSESFEDEIANPEAKSVHTEYSYNIHDRTTYQPGIVDLIAHWRDIVYNVTNGQGLLMLKDDLKDAPTSIIEKLVVDLPHASRGIKQNPNSFTALKLQESLQKTFNLFGNKSWPAWQYKTEDNQPSSEFRIITSLLPGTPIVTWNQVMLVDNGTSEIDPEYKTLIGLRSSPSMLHGEYNNTIISNGTIFAYTRLKSGNPGIVVLYNPTTSVAHANMTFMNKIPSEMTVNLLSKSYAVENVAAKAKLKASNILVSPKSAIVLTYVQED